MDGRRILEGGALAVTAQCFQQITGINIITYYAVRPNLKIQANYV